MATGFETVKARKARFAGLELDLSSGELSRDGQRFRLQGQPFQVLCVLLDRARQVVTREELQRQLWPHETFVDFDHGLNKAIAKLRESLEDSKASSRLIETIPRRGYRFTAEVVWVGPSNGLPIAIDALPRPEPRRFQARHWLAGGLVLAPLVTMVVLFNLATLFSWLGIRPTIQSVAVLPLVNLSNDPEQEYFADGITEQLITDLSYAKPLRVLSRSSTIGFKGSHLSVPEIAEQLHVDAVIEGTVLRVNDTIRVTTRLTAAKPERQLWAASYERSMSDAITLQNQIAADAVNQMRIQLTPAAQTQLSLERRVNAEAYDEYLQGRFLIRQEIAQKDKAIPHLEHAIRLDPNFAAAYAALGEAWGYEAIFDVPNRLHSREAYANALAYSQKAVSLDPNSSEAYSSLGSSLIYAHQWNDAEKALRHAIELDSGNPHAAQYLAMLLTMTGRNHESVRVSHELALANPFALIFQRTYAIALFDSRRYDEAIMEFERLLKLDPNYAASYGTYAQVLAQKGRFQEAKAALNHSPLKVDFGLLAWLYAVQGKTDDARQVLNEHASSPISPFTAVAHYLLGEQERGLAELDYLTNEISHIKTFFIKVDPLFDPMRNDPRFTEIVKKTGLLNN